MKTRRLVLASIISASLLASSVVAQAPTSPPLDREKLAARVRQELQFSWKAYEHRAWGHDELKPLSRTAHDWYAAPLLMTPVDALDTLLMMELNEDAKRATDLITSRLSFNRDISVKNFEVTIRLLGGLLSAYQMTDDQRLLRLADDLGTRLLPVFDSPTGMPYMYVNLKTGKTSGKVSNPAEIGTLFLEFGTLGKLTGKPAYFDKAKRALMAVYERRSKLGLVAEEIDVETGKWITKESHVGGGIDSYYEYLLKGWKLFGDADCERMWKESLQALNAHLLDEAPSGLWYGQVDMATGKRTATEFGALHAFLPGVLALGGDLEHAKRLQASCFKMWTLHGIEPEMLDYRTMKVKSPGYPLRPEIIESAYILHHFTKDPVYLEMGKTFLDALLAKCRTENGYTTLKNVVTGEKGDLMPSYFLAETLKYLWLLFSPGGRDVIPAGQFQRPPPIDFDAVVFNTEAHPLRRTW